MSAAVLQYVNSVVVAPDHDHLVAPEFATNEVARLLDLAFVPDEYPSALEDSFHLKLEYHRIGVKTPMCTIGFHQRTNFDRIKCHRCDLIRQIH